MSHPQNSPRGRFEKAAVEFTSATITTETATTANITTGNVTTLNLGGSGAQALSGNTTAVTSSNPGSALPGAVQLSAANLAFLQVGGVAALAINTTGTTWKYLNVTSKLPS